jgi:hypothetical protein
MIVGIVLTLLCYYANGVSIEEYGAIPNVYTLEVAEQNARAFSKTFIAANSSSDHTVEVPAGKEFYMLNVNVYDIYGVTVQFNGDIKFTDTISAWQQDTTGIFQFNESHDLTFSGKGVIDGQGLKWWRSAYLGNNYRPDLFYFYQCTNILITDLYLLNSPRFTISKPPHTHVISKNDL